MRDMVSVRRGRTHTFQSGPDIRIGRSQFDRSHGVKTTFDASRLVPILVDEVLPGDTFTLKAHGFARVFSPLDAPIMDNIHLETFYFFVPMRLLWEHWEDFNGAHDAAGAQDTEYTIPVCSSGTAVQVRSLAQYMGVPIGVDFTAVDVSTLPFRAYKLIYDEWFRDQNLISPKAPAIDDGPDAEAWGASDTHVYVSAKMHDYFTSALPYLQKGDAVAFPLSGTAPVIGIGKTSQVYGTSGTVFESDGGSRAYTFAADPTTSTFLMEGDAATGGFPQVFADLSGVGASIADLREAVAIQRLLEKDARGGTRYVEHIKEHFGVTVPDFRLQRPEYLGGGKSMLNVAPVANTSATASEDQGELRGVAAGQISSNGFAKSFVEHGYLIGLVRARGDITYFQGLDRMWSRSTRYDFYVPVLANLGEQSILNKEIFVSNSAATDDAVFGYQERWAEYRFKKSMVTGKFSPDASGALSHWHLAEDFSALPALNSTFIQDATPMARVTTVDSEPDFVLDVWFDMKCARPLPVFSIPSIMSGRF